MVTRISKTFNELKLESQTGLITYLTAGFPNQNLCLEIINELSKSGSDLIEIGMPFSDPMAEGPIIQSSSKISLDNGHTMELTFDLIKNFRKKNIQTPIILMGYYNPIYQYGNENFINRCLSVGVDGLIVVDLPPEHDSELCDLTLESDIDFIIEPHTRFKGEPGEQSTMFFLDPSGNALEFKAFKSDDMIFAID